MLSPLPSSGTASFAAPGTVFPHLLLDEVMPTLSGSEWALLCVVVRQTLGWRDPATGGRKSSDWLSHRQLRARTGRGSDAVCSAVDALVRRGLIEVTDAAGRTLATPAERRRARRLFYALSPRLLGRLREAGQAAQELPEKSKGSEPTLGENRAKMPPDVRPSRFRIAETTKETGTKYREDSFGKSELKAAADGRAPFKPARPNDEGCGCLRPLGPAPAPEALAAPSPLPPPGPETAAFLDLYRERFRRQRDGHPEPTPPRPVDQARLQQALAHHGPDRLERLAETFFGNNSALLHYGGYGLDAFLEVLPTLAVLRANPAEHALGRSFRARPRASAGVPRPGE